MMDFKELWADLMPEVRHLFEAHSQSITLKRGDFVYRQEDQPKGIYFVSKGLVGLVLVGASSGKEHLLRFFRQGQFFGHRALFSNEGYHGNTVVLEPTEVLLVPQKIILEAIQKYPVLLQAVVQVLARELRRCETQHVMILENEIQARVAQSLIYLKDLHPEHNWTRQEIANFCGSTTSTVIKTLADMETQGWISQVGRSIEILNREALLALQETSSGS